MSIQPQVDLQIINDLLINQGRKSNSPFILNRLDKAVSALQKNDLMQGYSARSFYLNYINKPEEAIELISDVMKLYGYKKIWLETKFSVARKTGNGITFKKAFEEYISNISSDDINLQIITEYLDHLMLYIDDSDNLESLLNSIGHSDIQSIFNELGTIRKSFNKYDLSLDSYRKVLDLSFSCIDKKYNVNIDSSLRFNDSIQIIHSCKLWSTDEAIELTKDINDAILAVDDIDFQLEADEIEVFCINFDISKLPNDFSLYSDDDEDEELVKIVQSRRESNPEFEALDV